MTTKGLNILKGVATFFLFLGAVGWFLGFAQAWSGRPFRAWSELPNTERHGIDLDSSGNIYCGSKFYARIQKYYPDGRFARAFRTKGGTGWGSDFGFRINEDDQLCITVSGMSKDHKRSVHRVRIYDQQGKLIGTERYETDGTRYWHDMADSAIDAGGNIYTFKGFLFPRVVKRTPSGQKSIIIGTPIWLWLIQAPFPAFALFFVSMFVVIFFRFKADAAELSVSTLDLIVDRQRLPSRRRFVFIVLGIIGIAVVLSIIIPIGFKTYPLLVIFSFVSFAITMAIIMLLAFSSMVVIQWRCIRSDFKLWKNSMFGSSLKGRYEAGRSLRLVMERDPVIKKTGKLASKIALLCLCTWFAILLLAICVVVYLDHVGVWQDLIDK